MDHRIQTQMFRAGAVARLHEILGEHEKSAGFGKAIWDATKGVAGKASNGARGMAAKIPSPVRELKPQAVTGASGSIRDLHTPQLRPWAQSVANNPGKAGFGAGVGATLVGGNMYVNSERQNMLDNYQQVFNDYQKQRGLDGVWGRTKALLGYLTGGQNYTNKLMGELAQFGAGQKNLSRGNRNMLAEWAARKGFAPANTVVSN